MLGGPGGTGCDEVFCPVHGFWDSRDTFQLYISGMAPTVGLLDAERVLQRLRGVRGQDDATETGRRATPQRIVDIVRNRTLK